MKEETKFRFRCACKVIIEYADKPALNYAVNYAKAGISMVCSDEIRVQALYILNNIQYWRGEDAKETREILKSTK